MEIHRSSNRERDYRFTGLQPAMTTRMAQQFRAWSGPPLVGLGCIIGYRALADGAVVVRDDNHHCSVAIVQTPAVEGTPALLI